MATLLDQSLDAIIASTRQKRAAASGRVGKGVARGAVKKAAAKKTAPKKTAPQPAAGAGKKAKAKAAAAQVPKVKVIEASSYATKIVVHGLPKDILNDAVKVGGVTAASLSYNLRGQSQGIATVMFKKAEQAKKAFDRYNGAPIDGGKTLLRVELVVDPTRKPLVARIQVNQIAGEIAAARKGLRAAKKAAAPAKKAAAPAKKAAPTKKAAPAKAAPAKKAAAKKTPKPKKEKKTLEQLDQEMSDYFAA